MRRREEHEEGREVSCRGRILRRSDAVQACLPAHSAERAREARQDSAEGGFLQRAHQLYTEGTCGIQQRHQIQSGVDAGPPQLRPTAAEERRIQAGRDRVSHCARLDARQRARKERTRLGAERSAMEEGWFALSGEAHGCVQLEKRRLQSGARRRPVRLPLLHLYTQRRYGQRTERHHRSEGCRHIRLAERREGKVAEARTGERRTEYGVRRGCMRADARRQDDVHHAVSDRPVVSALCTDYDFAACRCGLGKTRGVQGDERHALKLCPPCGVARRRVALLRVGHARRTGRTRHLASTHHVARSCRCGELGRTYQHAGQRDVPYVSCQRRPLLLKRRPCRHGRLGHLHRFA